MMNESQIKRIVDKVLYAIDSDKLSVFDKDVIAKAIVAAIAEYDRQNAR